MLRNEKAMMRLELGGSGLHQLLALATHSTASQLCQSCGRQVPLLAG
jgi:hypothetical protein